MSSQQTQFVETLLRKYLDSECTVISEYSGDIRAECRELRDEMAQMKERWRNLTGETLDVQFPDAYDWCLEEEDDE